mgnify:FL=1
MADLSRPKGPATFSGKTLDLESSTAECLDHLNVWRSAIYKDGMMADFAGFAQFMDPLESTSMELKLDDATCSDLVLLKDIEVEEHLSISDFQESLMLAHGVIRPEAQAQGGEEHFDIPNFITSAVQKKLEKYRGYKASIAAFLTSAVHPDFLHMCKHSEAGRFIMREPVLLYRFVITQVLEAAGEQAINMLTARLLERVNSLVPETQESSITYISRYVDALSSLLVQVHHTPR